MTNNSRIFRLYTEDKNTDRVMALANDTLDSFTTYYTTGHWQGNREQSLIVEVIAESENAFTYRAKMFALAERIKTENKQEAVYLTEQELNLKVI